MDFAIFSKTEVEEMFQTMIEHMPENMKNLAVKEFGSVEEWKKHYIEVVSSEEMQKGYAKVVEWYGGKEKFLSVAIVLCLCQHKFFFIFYLRKLLHNQTILFDDFLNFRRIYITVSFFN